MIQRFNVTVTYKDGRRAKASDAWLGEKVRGWGFNNQETMLYLNLGGENDEKTVRENVIWIPVEDIKEFQVEQVRTFETKKERLEFTKQMQS